MDLSHPGALFSGLILGVIGSGMALYGKKQASPAPLIGGLALCVLPCLVASVLAMWLLGGLCVGGVWWASKHGG